ncbi:MAG: hypothetical protein PQJ59_14620 [Spirochaetales bacterium]|nr:hypothetical protein [Spirochaetales bacterium]
MVRVFKNIFYILLAVFLLSACSFDFLNDSDDSDSSSSEDTSWEYYDETTGTLYYYADESEDSLEYMEYYDFDDDGQCTFVKHVTPSDTLLWSEVYGWDGSGNHEMTAHFGSDDVLDYYTVTVWSGDNAVQEILFDADGTHEGYQTWTFDSNDDMTNAASFDASEALEWAYNFAYTYDGSDLSYYYASAYDANGDRTGYYETHYETIDGLASVSAKTGYGDSSSSSNYCSSYEATEFPDPSSNTVDWNTALLAAPVEGTDYTIPTVPTLSLSDTELDYAWMQIYEYDDWGYTKAILNENYLPEYLERYAPDYLDEAIATEMEFETTTTYTRLLSKEVTYGDDTVVLMELTYDDPDAPEGCLNQVDLSGDGMLFPMSIFASYNDDGVPLTMSVSYKDDTANPFYTFSYDYTDLDSFDVDADYIQQVASVTLTNGDGEVQRYFTFDYDSTTTSLSIVTWESVEDVSDSEASPLGSLSIAYDDNGNAVSFTAYSYDDDGEEVEEWSYEYDYEDVVVTSEGVVATAEDTAASIAEQVEVLIGETYLELDGDDLTPEDLFEFFTDSGALDIALTFLVDLDLDQYIPLTIDLD